jgi:hypothetical protein
LSINATTGLVSGTPPAGTTSFAYSVIASNGVSPNATAGPFTVTVSAAPAAPVFTADSPPLTATVGSAYSYTFRASGNPAPTFALGGGAPAFLSINATTGLVSGTPPAGTTSFAYSVIASNGVSPNATAGPFTVTVSGSGPSTDTTTSGQALNSATAKVSTTASGDLLVAFVASDSPYNAGNTSTVSGGGLTWTLIGRENKNLGDAEVWTARATGVLRNAAITAKVTKAGYDETITVIAYKNAPGTGNVAMFTSMKGAPTGHVTTSQGNSWVFAIGDDWLNSIPRTLGTGQTLIHQATDSVGDTYWVQATNAITPTKGTTVTINDTAPTTDPYNLVL